MKLSCRQLVRLARNGVTFMEFKMIGRMVAMTLFGLCLSGTPGAAEPIRIGHPEPFPPIAEVKNGKSMGLAIDILYAAAARAGIEITFVGIPLDQLQLSLQDGRVGAAYGAVTPERLSSFDFSDPVLTTGGALYVRAPDTTPESLQAMVGKVVVTPGTGPLAALIRKNAPGVNLVLTRDYEESFTRVVRGDAVAAALNYHAGTALAIRLFEGVVTLPRRMFNESSQGIFVRKNQHAEFLARLNVGLATIRADGTWQKINHRWIGQ